MGRAIVRRGAGASLVVALVALGAVFVDRSPTSAQLATAVEDGFASAADRGEAVALTDLVDVDWDRVHVAEPYSPEAQIEADLGLAPDQLAEAAMDDSHDLVVFLRDRSVVATTRLPRTLLPATPPGGLPAARAHYRVERHAFREASTLVGRLAEERGGADEDR